MALRIITADERLSAANSKTTIAVFGPSGAGKTSLARTLPPDETIVIDLEAGMKSLQGWGGISVPVRSFAEAADIACLVGGVSPTADPQGFFSPAHHEHVTREYPELGAALAVKRYVFVDSITDLTRLAMAWAKLRPEAFSDRTGKPDTRGAYGLLARETIGMLKHLQHTPGKTVIFVGILERVVDDLGRESFQPQMEGGRASRELPGIVDEVLTLSLFDSDQGSAGAWRHNPVSGGERRIVCRSGNPWGLPAKDRSGSLDLTEPADLGAIIAKVNRPRLSNQA
ncbi:MAG TPA: ATP-binding protein [Bauldia sp.]|nr:ATP-binding protein [Bauldia sp.]